MDTDQTLTGIATRNIYSRDVFSNSIVVPAGSLVTVTEDHMGFVIRGRAGVRSVSTYTWEQIAARVECA